MRENERVMHELKARTISIDNAIEKITGELAADDDRLAMATIIAIKRMDDAKPEVRFKGYRDWENSEEITPDDTFRVYSVTKTFIAEVTHQLRDERKLKFEDKLDGDDGWIAKMLCKRLELKEAFAKLNIHENATVEDLLKHTSGIGNYSQGAFVSYASSNPRKEDPHNYWSLLGLLEWNEVVKEGKDKNDEYGKFNYSDSGYQLLGLIIECIEEKPFQQSVRERCIEKYNLNNTAFLSEIKEEKEVRYLAKGYIENPSTHEPASNMEYDTGKAAGGLLSTAQDMIKFGQVFIKIGRDKGELVQIPGTSSYLPGCKYARTGITVQQDKQGRDVSVFSGNARGSKAKVCCYKDGTVITILATWENLTVNIAKTLAKEHSTFKDVTNTILLLRDVYTDGDGKFNRAELLADWQKDIRIVINRLETKIKESKWVDKMQLPKSQKGQIPSKI